MTDEAIKDSQSGLSIRFIRQYDIKADLAPRRDDWYVPVMLQLANADERDIPFAQKIRDALAIANAELEKWNSRA